MILKANSWLKNLIWAIAVVTVAPSSADPDGSCPAIASRVGRRNAVAETAAHTAVKTATRARKPAAISFKKINALVDPAEQKKTLNQIMTKLKALKAQGQVGVVQVDLDLTSQMPVERTVKSLQNAGARYNIPELADPLKNFDQLPGYTNAAFDTWLNTTGLRAKYPNLNWGDLNGPDNGGAGAGSIYGAFRSGYWGSAPLDTDLTTPGLASFVRTVEKNGGKVVFVSNRPAGPEVSIAALKKGGIADPRLIIGGQGGSDQEVKAFQQIEIARIGKTVAVIDDRGANRKAVLAAIPNSDDVMSVSAAIPGFSAAADTSTSDFVISTFTVNPRIPK